MTTHAATGRWMEITGRFGLATKGLSYLLVAAIAIKVAVAGGGQAENQRGALAALADEPFGWLLLVLVAIGFAAYAVWRVAVGALDRDREGSDASGLGKRLRDVGEGLFYAGLAAVTVAVLAGASSGSSSGEEDKATAAVLGLPGGRWLVAAGGVGIVGAGLLNAYRALSTSFREDLKTEQMGDAEQRWYTGFGVAGFLSRGLVFALVGIFLIRAAWQYDPNEAVGLDGALQKLAGQPYGPILLGTVAFGLAAYGLFCLVQARYRRI